MIIIDSTNISVSMYYAPDTIVATGDAVGTDRLKNPSIPIEFTF